MRKLSYITIVAAGLVVGLFLFAGRALEGFGYLSASADTAVDSVTNSLPQQVRDRKLDADLERAAQELIDRQVQMKLADGVIEKLRAEVGELESATERRGRLLAEAYPVLQHAVASGDVQLVFAGEQFQLAGFQAEVDDLLAAQGREERLLEVKREGLRRLETRAAESRMAISTLREQLAEAGQEIEVLKSRRVQAQVESRTLDMMAGVSASGIVVESELGKAMVSLRKDVETLEARNQARREIDPSGGLAGNRLARQWDRLEKLKARHDAVNGANPIPDGPASKVGQAAAAKQPKVKVELSVKTENE